MEEDLPAARAIRFNRSIAREGMRPDASRRVDWTMVLLDTISPGCDIDHGKRGDLLVACHFGVHGASRSGLNPARSSAAKSSGCSHAAKCPPLSTSWK